MLSCSVTVFRFCIIVIVVVIIIFVLIYPSLPGTCIKRCFYLIKICSHHSSADTKRRTDPGQACTNDPKNLPAFLHILRHHLSSMKRHPANVHDHTEHCRIHHDTKFHGCHSCDQSYHCDQYARSRCQKRRRNGYCKQHYSDRSYRDPCDQNPSCSEYQTCKKCICSNYQ